MNDKDKTIKTIHVLNGEDFFLWGSGVSRRRLTDCQK